MIIKNENGNLRDCIYADPTFQNSKNRIVLNVMQTAQVKQNDDTWQEISVAVNVKTVVITDNIKINPVTYVIDYDNGTPAYSYLTTRTVGQIGATSLDDYAFQVVANCIEKYLIANGLDN